MKNNKLWLRVLALCLALVCTLTVVLAASYDLSGDGKTDVWDLQLAVNQEKTATYKAALTEALGGKGDELHPNENGEYEIYSVLGLYNMAKLAGKEGQKFVLKNNIDMQGMDWVPTGTFLGIFEGDGYTISNVNIVDDVKQGTVYCQGFFSKLGKNSQVNELNMRNVTVTVTDDADFVGLLAGSCTGAVVDCTTTGTVNDARTNLTKAVYVGTLLGRVENKDTSIAPTVTDESILLRAEQGELLTVAREAAKQRTAANNPISDKDDIDVAKKTVRDALGTNGQPVISKMAMHYAELESGSKTRTTGVIGWAPSGKYLQYNWQDVSGSLDYMDPTLAARRQTVVDKM